MGLQLPAVPELKRYWPKSTRAETGVVSKALLDLKSIQEEVRKHARLIEKVDGYAASHLHGLMACREVWKARP
jgi:hypothetical protein